MRTEQVLVRQLMMASEQECPTLPVIPDLSVRKLRVKLMAEELLEFATAFGLTLNINFDIIEVEEVPAVNGAPAPTNLVEAYDAIADMQVVNLGNAVAIGADLEPGFEEVHRSNCSKLVDGKILKNEFGKWLKGPNYFKPNLKPILDAQAQEAFEHKKL